MPDYSVKYNDCRMCVYCRPLSWVDRFWRHLTPTENVGICTEPRAIGGGNYPVSHYENAHLPCQLYIKN